MRSAVNAATDDEKLALLRAHPDLAGRAAQAGNLTKESTAEQAAAGLSALSADEFETFTRLNNAYRTKHGFPFILAVRGASKRAILGTFPRRLGAAPGKEQAE